MNNNEIIAKAKQAKSADELLDFAKENNIDMAQEGAQLLYDSFHATGELSDDELDSVAGGVGTNAFTSGDVKCKKCGNYTAFPVPSTNSKDIRYVCYSCLYSWNFHDNT